MTVNNAVGEAFLPVPYLKFFAHKRSATDFPFSIFHFSFADSSWKCNAGEVVMSSKTSAYWFAPNLSYFEKDFAAGGRFRSAQLSEPEAVATGSVLNVVISTRVIAIRDCILRIVKVESLAGRYRSWF
jgi:hypothetical protein